MNVRGNKTNARAISPRTALGAFLLLPITLTLVALFQHDIIGFLFFFPALLISPAGFFPSIYIAYFFIYRVFTKDYRTAKRIWHSILIILIDVVYKAGLAGLLDATESKEPSGWFWVPASVTVVFLGLVEVGVLVIAISILVFLTKLDAQKYQLLVRRIIPALIILTLIAALFVQAVVLNSWDLRDAARHLEKGGDVLRCNVAGGTYIGCGPPEAYNFDGFCRPCSCPDELVWSNTTKTCVDTSTIE